MFLSYINLRSVVKTADVTVRHINLYKAVQPYGNRRGLGGWQGGLKYPYTIDYFKAVNLISRFGVVHAWVGQILLKCNDFKR